MIRMVREGTYTLFKTANNTEILSLDEGDHTFAITTAPKIGEILISVREQKAKRILSLGRYRLYEVKDEPNLTDLHHLELYVGMGKWYGYLLPTGLPDTKDRKNRIIPTNEIITTTSSL